MKKSFAEYVLRSVPIYNPSPPSMDINLWDESPLLEAARKPCYEYDVNNYTEGKGKTARRWRKKVGCLTVKSIGKKYGIYFLQYQRGRGVATPLVTLLFCHATKG